MTPEENLRLIPQTSIQALADRFALGKITYKGEAWNAYTNQERLDDIEWIRKRIEHGYAHIDNYEDVLFFDGVDDGDDDCAAIMWLGCMLHEAWVRRQNAQRRPAVDVEDPQV